MTADAPKPRTREERKRARSQRGWSTRSNRVAQLPAAPEAPEAPTPEAAHAPEEPIDLLPPEPAAPPDDPSWVFGRPRWQWAAVAGFSVFVGVLVGFATRDGALVLSSTVACALALVSFLTLWRPPRLRSEAPPAAPPDAALASAPAPAASAGLGPPARPNRAARRRGVEAPAPQATGPVDLSLPEDEDVIEDPAPAAPAPRARGRR